jgi:3-deoxy-D-manno-octulosonate 8-phosphate phosphatase (KDO 8-P phosphatase)
MANTFISGNLSNQYSKTVLEKASKIKLLICDVDGVLSDGKVCFTNQGDEIKSFNIKDGLGIKLLMSNNIEVAIITGRSSEIVARRAKELGIKHVFQGKPDKRKTFKELTQTLNLIPEQVAHIGDDLPDLPLMKLSGLGICVADGYHFVQEQADFITNKRGGEGAVRDVSDLLLFAQKRLNKALDGYLS